MTEVNRKVYMLVPFFSFSNSLMWLKEKVSWNKNNFWFATTLTICHRQSGTVDPSYLLEQIELQISKVKEEAFSRKDLLERVEKWLAACEEECWLEEYSRVYFFECLDVKLFQFPNVLLYSNIEWDVGWQSLQCWKRHTSCFEACWKSSTCC